MNYAEIKNLDIANGPGLRVSLFVSGCTHHCKGCFNPESWNFNYGQPFTEATQEHLLELLENEHIRGLSLLGGEPFEPANQAALLPFLRKVRARFPKKDIRSYRLSWYLQVFCSYCLNRFHIQHPSNAHRWICLFS